MLVESGLRVDCADVMDRIANEWPKREADMWVRAKVIRSLQPRGLSSSSMRRRLSSFVANVTVWSFLALYLRT